MKLEYEILGLLLGLSEDEGEQFLEWILNDNG